MSEHVACSHSQFNFNEVQGLGQLVNHSFSHNWLLHWCYWIFESFCDAYKFWLSRAYPLRFRLLAARMNILSCLRHYLLSWTPLDTVRQWKAMQNEIVSGQKYTKNLSMFTSKKYLSTQTQWWTTNSLGDPTKSPTYSIFKTVCIRCFTIINARCHIL